MKYFSIGNQVYSPKYKVIGTITDKFFDIENDEILVEVKPDVSLTINTFHPTFQDNSPLYRRVQVKYSELKSMESIDMYKSQLISTDEIVDLNIPNLLRKKDFIKGTEVVVVDNYMLERMKSYPYGSYLYSRLSLSHLLGRKAILTGEVKKLSNGEFAVECKFGVGTYYVYAHSLQLIKRVNIFKRIWSKIKKINIFWIYISIYAISVSTIVILTLLKVIGN